MCIAPTALLNVGKGILSSLTGRKQRKRARQLAEQQFAIQQRELDLQKADLLARANLRRAQAEQENRIKNSSLQLSGIERGVANTITTRLIGVNNQIYARDMAYLDNSLQRNLERIDIRGEENQMMLNEAIERTRKPNLLKIIGKSLLNSAITGIEDSIAEQRRQRIRMERIQDTLFLRDDQLGRTLFLRNDQQRRQFEMLDARTENTLFLRDDAFDRWRERSELTEQRTMRLRRQSLLQTLFLRRDAFRTQMRLREDSTSRNLFRQGLALDRTLFLRNDSERRRLNFMRLQTLNRLALRNDWENRQRTRKRKSSSSSSDDTDWVTR